MLVFFNATCLYVHNEMRTPLEIPFFSAPLLCVCVLSSHGSKVSVQLRAGSLWEDARVEACNWVPPHVAEANEAREGGEPGEEEEEEGKMEALAGAARGGRWEVSVAVGKSEDPEMSMYVLLEAADTFCRPRRMNNHAIFMVYDVAKNLFSSDFQSLPCSVLFWNYPVVALSDYYERSVTIIHKKTSLPCKFRYEQLEKLPLACVQPRSTSTSSSGSSRNTGQLASSALTKAPAWLEEERRRSQRALFEKRQQRSELVQLVHVLQLLCAGGTYLFVIAVASFLMSVHSCVVCTVHQLTLRQICQLKSLAS